MYLHETDHKYSDTHQHMTRAKKAATDFVTGPLQPFPAENCFSCLPNTQNQKHRCYAVPPCDGGHAVQGKGRKRSTDPGLSLAVPLHLAPLFFAKD